MAGEKNLNMHANRKLNDEVLIQVPRLGYHGDRKFGDHSFIIG
jgi:hypothetical protein